MDKILVVDDEAGILELCRRILHRNGVSVTTAQSAEQALSALSGEAFDLVLTDLRMPGMDGMELLKRVKETYPHTSVIMMTGQATIESAIETLKSGAYDYIPKPFNINELTATVGKCLEHTRLLRQETILRETVYLYQFAQESDQARSEKGLLEYILERAIKALKADAGSVFIFSAESDTLVPVARFGDCGTTDAEIRIGENVAGWVAEKQQPLLIKDGFANTPQFKDLPVRADITSSLVAPLAHRDILFGVICLNRSAGRTAYQFTEYDLESLRIFTVHAMLIISGLRHYQALVDLDSLKTEFVSNVSHELRTPLMSIGGALEILAENPAFKEEKPKVFLDLISRNTSRMRHLVNDLLDFSRIETRRLTLQPRPFNLREVLAETLQDLGPAAAEKGIALSLEPGDDIEIVADRERIGQVLLNLVGNALKFTPGGGWVRISAGPEGAEHLRITVADSGIGIPKDKQEKIFKEFYQIDGSLSRTQPGFGLGLAIVRSIVEAHDGKVRVESEPGKGASFHIRLPRAPQES